jgi:hypothetical protein
MDDKVILVSRDELDEAVFAAAQECADTVPGLTVRQKMRWSLDTADKIMVAVDNITEAGKRSEAGRKAAQARHAKNKPAPGPAIPPAPKVDTAADAARMGQIDLLPPVPQTVVNPIPPPPHPSLAVPGATAAPFGAPPA